MASKKRTYKMWALFNTNRPPIFVEITRRECVAKGKDWLGTEHFVRSYRNGNVTIEKVTVVAASTRKA